LPNAWSSVFNTISGIARTAINGIITTITNGINTAIGKINELLDRISNIRLPQLNFGGISLFGNAPIATYGYNIPHLATGAVIPPNSEFAAILGDQRSGKNIEAPEGMLRQLIRDELGSMEVKVNVDFGNSTWGTFIREMRPHFDAEVKRVGKSALGPPR
jgi:hypothetical protein